MTLPWQQSATVSAQVIVEGVNRATPAFDAVARDAQRLEKQLARIESGMRDLVSAGIQAITANKGLQLIRQWADAAEEYQLALNQAERMVVELGNSTKFTTGQLTESAKRWSEALLVPSTQIAKAQLLWIRTGTIAQEQIDQLIPLTADYAATTQTSFAAAADAMNRASKTVDGSRRVLIRALGQLQPWQEKQLQLYQQHNNTIGAFQFAVGLLSSRMRGQREEQIRLQGESIRLDWAIGELTKQIGGNFLPIINKTVGRLADFVTMLYNTSPATKAVMASLFAVGTTMVTLGGISAAAGAALKLGVPAAIVGLTAVAFKAAVVIGGLTLAFWALGDTAEKRQATLNNFVDEFGRLSGIKLPKIGDWLRAVEDGVVSIVNSGVLGRIGTELNESILKPLGYIAEAISNVIKAALGMSRETSLAVEGISAVFRGWLAILRGIEEVLKSLKNETWIDKAITVMTLGMNKVPQLGKGAVEILRPEIVQPQRLVPTPSAPAPITLPPIGGGGVGGFRVPGRQHGGHVTPRGMALVGERGPELIRLPQGGTVLSSASSRNYMQSGGMSDAVSALTKQFMDLVVILDMLNKTLRSGGGGGRAFASAARMPAMGGGGGVIGGVMSSIMGAMGIPMMGGAGGGGGGGMFGLPGGIQIPSNITMPQGMGRASSAIAAGQAGGGGKAGSWWTPERVKQGVDYLTQHAGIPTIAAQALVARWAGVEAGAGPSAVNPRSGATGIAQWLGSRLRSGVPSSYEGQLAKAVGELKGPESRAYQMMMNAKTPQEAAIAAAQFERAEGYDRRTGSDAFVGKTMRTMQSLFGGGGQPAPQQNDSTASSPTTGASGLVRQLQGRVAGIRRGALSPQTAGWLDAAAKATGLLAEVTSGGQPGIGSGGRRTGSTRHDHGGAADLRLRDPQTGRLLDMRNPADAPRMAQFMQSAVAAGATGVGAGLGYMGPHTMHIGGGRAASWGGASWVRQAWQQGLARQGQQGGATAQTQVAMASVHGGTLPRLSQMPNAVGAGEGMGIGSLPHWLQPKLPYTGTMSMLRDIMKDSEAGHPLRSQLRRTLGIADPGESASWQGQDVGGLAQQAGASAWRKSISSELAEVLKNKQTVALEGAGQIDINLRGNLDSVANAAAASSGNIQLNLARPSNSNIFRGGDPGVPNQI